MNIRGATFVAWCTYGRSALGRPSVAQVCFTVSLAVFVVTRLVGLTDYPVSFISDEAVQAVDAARLVDHGFRDGYGDLLPTYLQNGPYLNLGTTVYLQIVPYLLFGYSEFAARSVSVLTTLSGAVAVSLLLRDVFRIRLWWSGVLLLSIAPAWFLHSRTALEAPTGCAFYSWFLYLALRARERDSPSSLYGAVGFGALTFYSYAPLKFVVLATALLLALSNARWLNARRPMVVRAVALAAVLALPELRFQLEHPGANVDQLRVLDSYLVDPHSSLSSKVSRFVDHYAYGLSPRYWYDPGETQDLARHTMKGWGNLPPVTLPPALVGAAVTLSRLRAASYRGLLLALLAAPIGAAAVEIQLPRSLPVVIPATVLTALGLDWLTWRLVGRARLRIASAVVLTALTLVNVTMLVDALRRGPTWTTDYGLYGLQYGARQVADAVRGDLRSHPRELVAISSTWANGTDTLMEFFLSNEHRSRVETLQTTLLGGADPYPALDRTTFVVTQSDLRDIRHSGLFERPRVQRTVVWPNDRVGFSFVRLRYSPRAPEILATKRRQLHHPVSEPTFVDGTAARVTHTPFDLGRVADLSTRGHLHARADCGCEHNDGTHLVRLARTSYTRSASKGAT